MTAPEHPGFGNPRNRDLQGHAPPTAVPVVRFSRDLPQLHPGGHCIGHQATNERAALDDFGLLSSLLWR